MTGNKRESQMKILHIDIEVAPNLGTIWGIFNQNIGINQLMETSYILCYAAKWHGKQGMIFDREKYNNKTDQFLLGIWELLDEADMVVHYNGARFDIPIINREFLLYDILPPSPFKQVDLYQVHWEDIFRW